MPNNSTITLRDIGWARDYLNRYLREAERINYTTTRAEPSLHMSPEWIENIINPTKAIKTVPEKIKEMWERSPYFQKHCMKVTLEYRVHIF